MGMYLNPDYEEYRMTLNGDVFVDKSLLIENTNKILNTVDKYLCIVRPRRFGKTTDAYMLVAYYSKGCDSHDLFDSLKIANSPNYEKHLNKHNVIHLNMQRFVSRTSNIDEMLTYLKNEVVDELLEIYDVRVNKDILASYFEKIYTKYEDGFIFIIDEWDCLFREFKKDVNAQKQYLDFLRDLLKDQKYVEMVYMTGILPVKKYGTHSGLNMFDEISMLQQRGYSSFMGFTEEEVNELCQKFDIDFKLMQEWYNGYHLEDDRSVYSPRSVSASIQFNNFTHYWSQTETFLALQEYIDLEFEGLKEDVISMIEGNEVRVRTSSFQNDMSTFRSKDDVLTLLIHLGYLAFNSKKSTVYIPNNEVKDTFITSIKNSNWDIVTKLFKNANDLLEATWNMDSDKDTKEH